MRSSNYESESVLDRLTLIIRTTHCLKTRKEQGKSGDCLARALLMFGHLYFPNQKGIASRGMITRATYVARFELNSTNQKEFKSENPAACEGACGHEYHFNRT